MRKIACTILFALLGTLCFGCGGYPKQTNKLTYTCERGTGHTWLTIRKIATKETSSAATGNYFDQAAYYEWKWGLESSGGEFTRAEFDSFTDSGYGQITSGPLAECDPTALDNYVKPTPGPTTATVPKPTVKAEPTRTVSQQQAEQSAEDYLNYSAFSRAGLIDQLEYEGFSTADATYGVDAQNANWNAQAALMAQEYLDYSSFSRTGLIDQLIFEGFTRAQATYGVNAAGL